MGVNPPKAAPSSPCDGCELRRKCARGFDCKAYRAHLEAPHGELFIPWRGQRLKRTAGVATP